MPPKRVVHPKPLKETCFRKAEYGKVSKVPAVVTCLLPSLASTPKADILDLVSEVQQSVGSSGITHFWVMPETQSRGLASELALEAAT